MPDFTRSQCSCPPAKEESGSDLLSTTEASAVIQITAGTLNGWRYLGKGPDYVKLGRKVRYRRADLTRFIEDNVHKACQ